MGLGEDVAAVKGIREAGANFEEGVVGEGEAAGRTLSKAGRVRRALLRPRLAGEDVRQKMAHVAPGVGTSTEMDAAVGLTEIRAMHPLPPLARSFHRISRSSCRCGCLARWASQVRSA